MQETRNFYCEYLLMRNKNKSAIICKESMKKIAKNLCLISLLVTPLLSLGGFNYSNNSKIEKNKVFLNPLYTPEDRYYSQNGSQKDYLASIGDLESTWDVATGKGVTVAVIDTGLDINHFDFQENVSDKSCYIYTQYESEDIDAKYETKIDVGKQFLAHDENGSHGTCVTGVIAANNNEYGIIGIAFDATILAIRCDLDSHSVNEAIKYATDNGANVLNISLGGYAAPYTDGTDNKYHDVQYEDYDERDATSMVEGINYAYEHNVIIVAAAGNENTSESTYPASNDHVIGVGALDEKSTYIKAYFSNFNKLNYEEGVYPNVDIVAPGYVLTDLQTSINDFETIGKKSGTSFSAPIISGAAALWCEKNPNGTPDQFEEALYETANDIGSKGYDRYFGNGSLNIEKLVNYKKEVEVEKIEVTKNIELKIGEEYQLAVNVIPSNATYEISYQSSDENIVTVTSDGLIRAVANGEAEITIKAGKISEICHVIVKNKENKSPTCGGNIYLTSSIFSLLSLVGIFFIVKKKLFKEI